jgi:hypothetical protein
MADPLPLDIALIKRCCMCKIVKPLTEFNRHGQRRDGLQPHCRDCNRARSRRYYAENRDKHLVVVRARIRRIRRENQTRMLAYLREHPCVDCGEDDVVVLEFDHLRDKRMGVGLLLRRGVSWETIVAEIAKCEVVCANCHRRRTHQRSGSYRITLQ